MIGLFFFLQHLRCYGATSKMTSVSFAVAQNQLFWDNISMDSIIRVDLFFYVYFQRPSSWLHCKQWLVRGASLQKMPLSVRGELLYSLIQPQRSIFFQVSSSSGRLPPSEATGFHFFDLSQIEKTVEIPQIEYVAPRNATHAGWFSLIQIQMVDLTKCNSESDPKQCGSSFLDLSVQCLRFSEWAKCGISAAFCRSCAYGSKNLLPPKLLLPKICGVQCQQSLDVSTKAPWDSLNIKRWRFCGSISKDNHVHIPVQKTRHVHVHVPVERPVEVGYWVGYWDDFDIFLGTPLY